MAKRKSVEFPANNQNTHTGKWIFSYFIPYDVSSRWTEFFRWVLFFRTFPIQKTCFLMKCYGLFEWFGIAKVCVIFFDSRTMHTKWNEKIASCFRFVVIFADIWQFRSDMYDVCACVSVCAWQTRISNRGRGKERQCCFIQCFCSHWWRLIHTHACTHIPLVCVFTVIAAIETFAITTKMNCNKSFHLNQNKTKPRWHIE